MTVEPKQPSNNSEAPPRPTYAPAAMAMGIMMMAWGIVTYWMMSLFGAGVFVWALWSWISEICQQWRMNDES